MKWISTTNDDIYGEGYELWAGDNKLVRISFSQHTRIGRVMSSLGKRLFFFEKKGLFTPRAVITNEYGIRMGMVDEEKPGKGHLEFEGKRYAYNLNTNETGNLVIFDEQSNRNLLSCSFNAVIGKIAKTRSLLDTKIPSLLLVLCWYAFQQQHQVAGSETPSLA